MDYTEIPVRHVNSYKGIIVDVDVEQVKLVNGNVTLREVVKHPGGVTVVPVDGEGRVCCVRQYRFPFGEHLLEVPAGKLEYGEEPLPAAVRELSEETGLTAGRMISMGEVYTSPGFSREILHLYLALDLEQGAQHLDNNEFLDLRWLPMQTLYGMVMSGEIRDAKTVAAVLKARELLNNGGI